MTKKIRFNKHAKQAALECAKKYKEFTTDDIWQNLKNKGIPEPRDNRTIGSIMVDLQTSGEIKQTGTYIKTTRPQAHSRPIRVWKKA